MPKLEKEKLEKIKRREIQFKDLFHLDAKQVAALLVTGHNLCKQGRLQDAKRIYEGVAVLDGRNPYVHAVLGSIYQREENYEAAIMRYNMALTLFPDDVTSLLNRGEICIKFGLFEHAAADLKKVIALDTSKKSPTGNRARMLAALIRDALTLAKEKGLDAVVAEKKRIDQQIGKRN